MKRLKKRENKIASWYKLGETSIWLMSVHIFFGLIRVAGAIISPIFAAKVTVALVNGDYSSAWLNLAIELGIVFITYIAYDQVYRNAGRLFRDTYLKVQRKIYKKAYRAKDSNFKVTSREKLLNIIGTDIDVIGVFPDTLAVRISRVVQVVVTLSIVFATNVMVGLFILGLSVLNLFILLYLNKLITKHKAKMYENKDKLYEKFSNVLSNQELIKQYDMGESIASDYFERCDKYCKSFIKNKNATGLRDNYFVLFYKSIIFAITCFMIILVKNENITLELYFIVVPYLLSSVELINEIINITASIEEVSVSTKRINTVLDFTDEEFIKFGSMDRASTDSKLLLLNVSYSNTNPESVYFGELKDITMKFAYGKINVIKGKTGCGKRIIYGLIARRIAPDKGVLMLNDINMLEYSKKAYRASIFNTLGKPRFLNDSIMNNFLVSGSSMETIENICKDLNLYDYIMSLPLKFGTNITDPIISKEKSFLLSLAIANMMDAKIISLYEIPEGLSLKDRKEIKSCLSIISMHKTILLFTHNNEFDDIAAMIYKMENGSIVSCENKKILNDKKC